MESSNLARLAAGVKSAGRLRGQLRMPSGLHGGVSTVRVIVAKHPIIVALLVMIAVGSSVAGSFLRERRYEALARISLRNTSPGRQIKGRLELEVQRIQLELFSGGPDSVEIRARAGDPRVEIVASGDRPDDLPYRANAYASELLAWDRGPAQQHLQHLYRELLAKLASADWRHRASLARQIHRLVPRVVTDADYEAARESKEVSRPDPVRHGLLAFGLGLLIAFSAALAVERLRSRATAVAK
jgi:hypothetical protein